MEENVAGDPYLSGDGFSLTDIYLAVVSRWAQQDAWRPTHIPKVERLTIPGSRCRVSAGSATTSKG